MSDVVVALTFALALASALVLGWFLNSIADRWGTSVAVGLLVLWSSACGVVVVAVASG